MAKAVATIVAEPQSDDLPDELNGVKVKVVGLFADHLGNDWVVVKNIDDIPYVIGFESTWVLPIEYVKFES